MSSRVVNPYASQDLYVATTVHARRFELVSRSDKDGKPFSRQVDAWWMAMAIGVRLGQRVPLPAPQDTTKFNDGVVLASDPWRITQLEMLALAEEGEEVLDAPTQVIRIASEYANGGFPWLLDQLLGVQEPTLTLINRLGADL